MALDNKYRVHEVAKDFGVSTKEIMEIMTKYRTEPKNHMQVLDDADLSVIFEYMTQHHQVKDIESRVISAWCRAAPCLTIERPRPVPPVILLWLLSTR